MKAAARAALGAVLAGAALACQDNESAIARGDRLWADSSFTEATAEYSLAADQRGDREALARLAHARARAGDLSEARDAYARLLAIAPEYTDQAVYDYLYLMDRATRRGDDFGMATALQEALRLRPELQLPETVRAAAGFQREQGALDEAEDYYRRALTTLPPDSTPEVLYDVGLLNEELNRCETAIDYFRAFRIQALQGNERRWRTLLGEARWHTGNCAFKLASAAQRENRVEEALADYGRMIQLGEPENLLDQAWFEQGEILYGLGRYDEALASYRAVVDRNPARTGQLVVRAEQRIDEIRFRPEAGVPRPPDA